jgi:hypothetical protein
MFLTRLVVKCQYAPIVKQAKNRISVLAGGGTGTKVKTVWFVVSVRCVPTVRLKTILLIEQDAVHVLFHSRITFKRTSVRL